MKPKAIWTKCSDQTGRFEHEMLDFCSNCAPFWNHVPRCPIDSRKLTEKGYCKDCKKFYDITDKPTD